MFLWGRLWVHVVGAAHVVAVSDVAHGHHDGSEQVLLEHELPESDGVPALED